MGWSKKIAGMLIWTPAILVQIIVSFIAGQLAFPIGEGKIPASVINMWLGITFSVFLIGTLVLLLRQSANPKKHLPRLGFTALGVSIPLAVISTFGYALNADNEIIGSGLDFFTLTGAGAFVFDLSAPLFGTVGFYIPSWIRLEKTPIRLIGASILIPVFYLFLLGYVQGYYLPEYNLPYNYDETITYTIRPETILESLNRGETDVFTLTPSRPDEVKSPIGSMGSFSWSQEDYLKIANALHQFVWKETLENWHIISADYLMAQCQNMTGGFDSSSFYFYKHKGSYSVVHRLWINPFYGEVEVNETNYSYARNWKSIDLDNLIVNSADVALRIAEQNGGTEARATSNGGCRQIYIDLEPQVKYTFMSHPFDVYDWGWKIIYSFDDYADYFEMNIDPYTGKRYAPCAQEALCIIH